MTDSTTASHPGGTFRLGSREVARIGYGAMQLEGFGRTVSHEEGVAVVRRALELGVDHIDTAQFYGAGRVNEILRDALAGVEGVTLVSKVGAVHVERTTGVPLEVAQKPHELREQVEQNLHALGVEQLAAVNIRRTDAGVGIVATGDQIVPLDDQLAEMIALRDEGKIDGIGLSNVSLDQLRQALPAGIVTVQNAYNVLTRDDEELLRISADEGIAWAPMFPLGSAFDGFASPTQDPAVIEIAARIGATPAQVAIAWLLEHSPSTLLIAGTASIDHLEENVAAGGVHLDDAAMTVLDGLASRA